MYSAGCFSRPWDWCSVWLGVFRLAWGVTKILVGLLVTAAAVTLVGGVLFAGGLVLLLPIALVGIALGLLKAVV